MSFYNSNTTFANASCALNPEKIIQELVPKQKKKTQKEKKTKKEGRSINRKQEKKVNN